MANAHRPNLCLTSSPLCSCASTPFPTSSLSFVSLPSADLPQRELWLSFSSYCISQVDFHSAPILLISGFSLSQFTPLSAHPSLFPLFSFSSPYLLFPNPFLHSIVFALPYPSFLLNCHHPFIPPLPPRLSPHLLSCAPAPFFYPLIPCFSPPLFRLAPYSLRAH